VVEPVDGTEPVPHIAQTGPYGGAQFLFPHGAVGEVVGESQGCLFGVDKIDDAFLDAAPDSRDRLFQSQSLMGDETDSEIVHLVARYLLRKRAQIVVPGGEFLAQ
jgi:hypothetical protein